MPKRNEVLVIVPPNSNTAIDGQLLTVTRPEEHSDWSDFMSLGALSLVSALGRDTRLAPVYVDGTVTPLSEILAYVTERGPRILAVCVGALTANYQVGVDILRHAKEVDSRIATVIGNDHFTALPAQCMNARPCIDFGFAGNEVVQSFTGLMGALSADAPIRPEAHPGLVTRGENGLESVRQRPEPVFAGYDYSRVDATFEHTTTYREQFEVRVASRVRELTGREVRAGVPVELGRGCVKFAADDACSFCSIQYGGLWKNQLRPADAWSVIERAWANGFDYLYVTADELPLTFAPLLKAMAADQPSWWRSLHRDRRPMLVGYARADGIADPRRTRALVDLGIQQVMIGMDAGSEVSLRAMNKPMRSGRRDPAEQAERLFESNWKAVEVARDHEMLIRTGFVIGHIGLTSALLEENVEKIVALIDEGSDVISAVDVEVLQPTPGSLDWTYLTSPRRARATSDLLGLPIDDEELRRVAETWRDEDMIVPELAMRDYAAALMPDVSFSDLAQARASIRECAKDRGIVVGE